MRFKDLEKYESQWLSTLSHDEIANADFPLITDRTADDESYAEYVSRKSWDSMTDQERIEYLCGFKGSYNASDLNRVGYAINYLAAWIRSAGHNIDAAGKTDWVYISDVGTPEEAEYLDQVGKMRNTLSIPFDTPEVPEDLDDFGFVEANDIEQILADLAATLERMDSVYPRSGMPWLVCGSPIPYILN